MTIEKTEKKNLVAVKSIVVLLVIAILCVAILAVLDKVLYVEPDLSAFSLAAEGEYKEEILDKGIKVSGGRITSVVSGTVNGAEVIGIYAVGNKPDKADSFTVVLIINKATGVVVGIYIPEDGSSPGFSYLPKFDASKVIGKNVESLKLSDVLVTGASRSSDGVYNAVQAAAEYFAKKYQ